MHHFHKTIVISITILTLLGVFTIVRGAFNEQINYQGKLTDSSNVAVSDGNKCMRFSLYTVSSGGSAIWTEEWKASTSYVVTTSGLFSVLLGSNTSLSSVNFNQSALYLQVDYDPDCPGTYLEVFSPRKRLGAVPAAFEAEQLGGYTWEGPGTIGSTTPSTAAFTTLSTSGNVGIKDTSPDYPLEILSTTTPQFVISNVDDTYYSSFSVDSSGDLTILASGGDISLGSSNLTTTGRGTFGKLVVNTSDLVVNATGYENRVGIGTATPGQTLHVEGQCVTGDSLLPIVSAEEISNLKIKRDPTSSNLEPSFQEVGSLTNLTRIDQVNEGDYVLSLNEKTGRIEPAKINGLLDMGVKPVFKLITETGKTIRTTGNHPYLAKQKSSSFNSFMFESSIDENSPSQSDNNYCDIEKSAHNYSNKLNLALFVEVINNSCCQSDNSTNEKKYCEIHNDGWEGFLTNDTLIDQRSNAIINAAIADDILSGANSNCGNKSGNTPPVNIICPRLANILETTFTCSKDNLYSINYDYTNSQDTLSTAQWTKVIYLQPGDEIAVSNEADIVFEKIVSIEYVGEEQVYDIEVEGTHNFIANGIVAHNTYISGNVGIGDTTPDYPLEILSTTSPQFAISNVDGTYYSTFGVDASGDLTILASGGDISLGDENLTTTGSGRFDGGLGVGVAPSSSYGINITLSGSSRGVNYTNSAVGEFSIGYGFTNSITVSGSTSQGYGSANSITASGSNSIGYGSANSITASGSNSWGFGSQNTITSSGASTNQSLLGVYSSINPHAAGVTAYGEYIYSTTSTYNNPTVNQMGIYVDWRIAGTDTSNKRWAIYNASTNTTAGKVFLGLDNVKTYWGTGYDASIYYDGTDLKIDTSEVGTGALNLIDNNLITTGNVGIGDATPDYPLEILSTTSPQFAITYQDNTIYSTFGVNSGGDLTIANAYQDADIYFGVNDGGTNVFPLFIDGATSYVGIGTTSPQKKLDVLYADSSAQLRLSQTGSVYSEFYVAPTTGDLTVSLYPSTSANDILFNMPGGTIGANLWVCEGSNCGATAPVDGGNLILENALIFDNDFRIEKTTDSITVYASPSDAAILIFDDGQ